MEYIIKYSPTDECRLFLSCFIISNHKSFTKLFLLLQSLSALLFTAGINFHMLFPLYLQSEILVRWVKLPVQPLPAAEEQCVNTSSSRGVDIVSLIPILRDRLGLLKLNKSCLCFHFPALLPHFLCTLRHLTLFHHLSFPFSNVPAIKSTRHP